VRETSASVQHEEYGVVLPFFRKNLPLANKTHDWTAT
jgi:hypothetical protein